MIYRTRYMRAAAACTLLRDLGLRTTNPVLQEYCNLAVTLLSAPTNQRAAIDLRVSELVAAAEARRARVEKAVS